MDQESAVIGAVIAAICFLPFVLILKSKKKTAKEMRKALQEIANKYSCSITEYEISGDFIIGMDTDKNYVFFYKKTKTHEDVQAINLADFYDCSILNASATPKNKTTRFPEITRLDLRFIANQNKGDKQLSFFNAEENLQLNGELEVIKKWAKSITEQLQKIT